MKKMIAASFVVLSTASFAQITTMPVHIVPMAGEAILVKEIKQRANLMPGPVLRPIYTTMQVQVMGTSCTQDTDFEVRVSKGRSEQIVNVVRVQPDPCDTLAKPMMVELETTQVELSSRLPIRVANRLLAEEYVTH